MSATVDDDDKTMSNGCYEKRKRGRARVSHIAMCNDCGQSDVLAAFHDVAEITHLRFNSAKNRWSFKVEKAVYLVACSLSRHSCLNVMQTENAG